VKDLRGGVKDDRDREKIFRGYLEDLKRYGDSAHGLSESDYISAEADEEGVIWYNITIV
jgi:hypothetical protein